MTRGAYNPADEQRRVLAYQTISTSRDLFYADIAVDLGVQPESVGFALRMPGRPGMVTRILAWLTEHGRLAQ